MSNSRPHQSIEPDAYSLCEELSIFREQMSLEWLCAGQSLGCMRRKFDTLLISFYPMNMDAPHRAYHVVTRLRFMLTHEHGSLQIECSKHFDEGLPFRSKPATISECVDMAREVVSGWNGERVQAALKKSTCRSCGAQIYWGITKNGKKMPIDVEVDKKGQCRASVNPRTGDISIEVFNHPIEGGRQSHHYTCPQGARWRKKKKA